jgi:hypothetical protein
MRRSEKITWLAVAGFMAFAGCANPSGNGTATTTDPTCATECDSAMDVCSRDCENHVENDLCAQECIDKLQKCKRRCE